MCDLLAIGPHPDDIELAAGGTVARFREEGKEVVLLDLTRGERATRGTPGSRAQEAIEAAQVLGVERECLEIPDTGVSARAEDQLSRLVEALRRHRPRLIVTLHGNDTHPDHVEGAELVRRASYLSGVRNYPVPGGEVFRPERVLFAMGRGPFVPDLVVDVTATYARKREALAAYDTQFRRDPDDPLETPISDPGFLKRIEARDRYYGGMIGAEFGEPFSGTGPVPVRRIEVLLGKDEQ